MGELPPAAPKSTDSALARFEQEVVARGDFAVDWFTSHVPLWEPTMRSLEGRHARVLEIGSFEGLSACYVLWRLPDATITCIDTFRGSPEQHDLNLDVSRLEATFDANVGLVDRTRVHKLVGESRTLLPGLEEAGHEFDLVYVDGSHQALDVIVDAALSWRVLKDRGVIVFDDYRWPMHADEPFLRPDTAVDAFLAIVAYRYEPVFSGYQLAVRKIA